MAKAGADEIVVSEATAILCRISELTFEDVGEHELKVVPELVAPPPGRRRLMPAVATSPATHTLTRWGAARITT